jgi:hypothetical protein
MTAGSRRLSGRRYCLPTYEEQERHDEGSGDGHHHEALENALHRYGGRIMLSHALPPVPATTSRSMTGPPADSGRAAKS